MFVSGLGEANGKSLVEEIKAAGNANVEFIEADVTREADVAKVMERADKAGLAAFIARSTTPAYRGPTSRCTNGARRNFTSLSTSI